MACDWFSAERRLDDRVATSVAAAAVALWYVRPVGLAAALACKVIAPLAAASDDPDLALIGSRAEWPRRL